MKKINNYSFAMIGMYTLSFIIMEYGASNWVEGLSSFPIIILVVFWSEKMTSYLKNRNNQPSKIIFYTDIFIINYSVLFALVTSLVFQRGNVDARGWWPMSLIIGEFCAILLGFLFAILALMLNKHHNKYTNCIAIAIFVGYVIFSLLPWRLVHFGQINAFTIYMIILFIFHLVICLYQQLRRFCQKKS